MADKGQDPNARLILGETHERRSYFGRTLQHAPSTATQGEGRFEVMTSSPLETEKKKPAKEKEAPAAEEKKKITSDNYQQAYLENQQKEAEEYARDKAARQEAERKKAETDKSATQKAAELERHRQRARARELQDQLGFWRQQQGQGLYDEAMIEGMIGQIESELGSIPQELRY